MLTGPTPNNVLAAFEAERDQLAPELGRVMASLGPAPLHEGDVGGQHTVARCLLPRRCVANPKPAPNSLALDAEFGGDVRKRGACRVQPGCLFVECLAALV